MVVPFVETRWHGDTWQSRGVELVVRGGEKEVSGFECVEFEALVRELDEDIWWPVMYMCYICGSWSSGERSRLEIHT